MTELLIAKSVPNLQKRGDWCIVYCMFDPQILCPKVSSKWSKKCITCPVRQLKYTLIGSQTSTCTLYERLKLAEHFAAIMKINGDLRKLYGFKHFGGVHPNQGCENMTSLSHNHKIENISHPQANISD